MCVSLIGCGKKSNEKQNNKTVENKKEKSSVSNPWEELEKEELFKKLQVTCNIPDESDQKTFRYNEKEKMGEISYIIDDKEYNLRIGMPNKFTDISGLYIDWEKVEDGIFESLETKIYTGQLDGKPYKLLQMYDIVPGVMYSLSVTADNLDNVDLTKEMEKIYIPMQGES